MTTDNKTNEQMVRALGKIIAAAALMRKLYDQGDKLEGVALRSVADTIGKSGLEVAILAGVIGQAFAASSTIIEMALSDAEIMADIDKQHKE